MHQYKGEIYISPEINLWISSDGYVTCDQIGANSSYYIIPASSLSRLNSTNVAELSVSSIKYASGPNTIAFLNLHGSYYVVATNGNAAQGNINYYFQHPPYTSDIFINTPQGLSGAENIFMLSIAALAVGIAIPVVPLLKGKTLEQKKRGLNWRKATSLMLRSFTNKLGKLQRKSKITAVLIIALLFMLTFSVASYSSMPKPLPVLPMKYIYAPPAGQQYNYNTTITLHTPGVTSKHDITQNGPLPFEGGINSTQLYRWAYNVQVTKISQHHSIPFADQSVAITGLSMSIGDYSLPVGLNPLDNGKSYYNGGIVANPSGTFDTGTEFSLSLSLTNEISVHIPDGNYTMFTNVTLTPIACFGPYYTYQNPISVDLTFPIWINNNSTLSQY